MSAGRTLLTLLQVLLFAVLCLALSSHQRHALVLAFVGGGVAALTTHAFLFPRGRQPAQSAESPTPTTIPDLPALAELEGLLAQMDASLTALTVLAQTAATTPGWEIHPHARDSPPAAHSLLLVSDEEMRDAQHA